MAAAAIKHEQSAKSQENYRVYSGDPIQTSQECGGRI